MRNRAVSSTLNYVLSLGIMALLVTGLLSAGGGFVEDRQEEVVRSELRVIGQQIASDIQRVDRLATAGDGNEEVQLSQTLPERISGTTYRISLETSPSELVLESTDPDVSVSVRFQTTTTVVESNAGGGTVVVTYTSASGQIEVGND